MLLGLYFTENSFFQVQHERAFYFCKAILILPIITIPTKLKLCNTCILPIFLYGSECWAVTKRDVLKIDALDQWCLRKLLGIKWYHHVRNDKVRRTTGQQPVGYCPGTASFSVRPYCKNARRDRCQEYHNCFPFRGLEETTRTSSYYVDEDYPARPEIKQSLTITVAQNRRLWRLMSAFGAAHS